MTDKSPTQSKKFIAYMVGDLSWTLLLGAGLYWTMAVQNFGVLTVLMAMVIVKGFVSTGYIISQAALDRYTRVATLITGREKPPPDAPPAG